MSSKEKLIIPYPVVVEGKYDKIKLSSVICANIIPTDGFSLFKKAEKAAKKAKTKKKFR